MQDLFPAEGKTTPTLRFPEFEDEKGWVYSPLEKIATIVTGNTPSTSDAANYGGTKNFVSPADISDGRFVEGTKTLLSDEGYSKTRKIPADSILFVCIGSTIGKVAQNTFECSTNQQINSVIPFDRVYNAFIYYSLKHISLKIAELSGKQAVPIINKSLFSSVVIGIPFFDEQQKIADCLSSLDELIAAHTQKYQELQCYKKGLLQNLFPTKGETVPELRFPEFKNEGKWEFRKLADKDISDFVKKRLPLSELSINTYVSTENILADFGGIAKASKLPPSGSFTAYESGDILIANIRPYLKKVWVANRSGGASNDVIVVRPKNGNAFLSCILKSEVFINYVMQGAKGVKMPRGDIALMKEYPVAVPNSEEQQKIADCLSSLDKLITTQAQKIEELKSHKKGLMQQLFPVMGEVTT